MLTEGGSPLHLGPKHDEDRFTLLVPPEPRRGGEGTVWKASVTDEDLNTPLVRALKVMHPSDSRRTRREQRKALETLVRLLQSVRLEHLVELHGVFVSRPEHERATGADDRRRVLVLEMEWIDGETVEDAFRGRPVTALSLTERVRVVHSVAQVLGVLHAGTRMDRNTVVFRDVKPSNCVLHPTRGAILVDPGTIQLPASTGDPQGAHTPEYSAPEVIADRRAVRAPASDAWSLGGFAAYCLLGRVPPADPAEFASAVRGAIAEAGGSAALADHLLALRGRDAAGRPPLSQWAEDLAVIAPEVDRDASPTAAPKRRTHRPRRVALAVAAVTAAVLALGGAAVATGVFRPAALTTVDVAAKVPAGSEPPSASRVATSRPSASPPSPTPSASPSAAAASLPPLPVLPTVAPTTTPTRAPRIAKSTPPPTHAAAPVAKPTQQGCLATAYTGGAFSLAAGGTPDAYTSGGPNPVSAACDFIALKLTTATYVTYARACLDTATGAGAGRCGQWVRLSYPNTWDTLLTDVDAPAAWTLQMYSEGQEDVRFQYTR